MANFSRPRRNLSDRIADWGNRYIKERDIEGSYIHVQRMKICMVRQLDNGTWSKQAFTVAEYTKSVAGAREVYLRTNARKIFSFITYISKGILPHKLKNRIPSHFKRIFTIFIPEHIRNDLFQFLSFIRD